MVSLAWEEEQDSEQDNKERIPRIMIIKLYLLFYILSVNMEVSGTVPRGTMVGISISWLSKC